MNLINQYRVAKPYSRILSWLLTFTLTTVVQGCVTTEELYAEYDEQSCRVALVELPGGKTMVQELVSDRSMRWEPAIYFALGDDVVSAIEKRRLDRDIAVLKQYRELRVSVRGYADRSGSNEFNRDLAARRATSVVNYLIAGGLSRSRIEKVSEGEDLPIVRTRDEQKLQVNRRVELLLMDINGNLVPYEPIR